MKKLLPTLLFIFAFAAFASAQVSLKLDFQTGNDDLRGKHDNVNVIFVLTNGRLFTFKNVNESKRWADRTDHTVTKEITEPLNIDDIAGMRLETTFRGGIDGDNWNLDKLVVTASKGGTQRELLNQTGRPLFRFTGDKRVKEFRFTAAPLAAAPPVRTRFNPRVHGFQFVNNFRNIIISQIDWTTGGLCGGMVYAALDYYNNSMPVPRQDYTPAEGTTLQSYLFDREMTSILKNLSLWGELGFNPHGRRNKEFFTWGIQTGSGYLGTLMNYLDRGIPLPLGLKACGSDCNCPNGCPGEHQVLAIGYSLGRYNGDPTQNVEDLSIYVYDPNYPNRTMTLKANKTYSRYEYKEEPGDRWRAYFPDQHYIKKTPPVINTSASELLVQFVTGTDDLRGGRDNVNVILLLRSGEEIRFDNVNNGKRWVNKSTQNIVRTLPRLINPVDIAGIRLETTFRGGIDGDNWNLNELWVRIRSHNRVDELYETSGNPIIRFTGSTKTKTFNFR